MCGFVVGKNIRAYLTKYLCLVCLHQKKSLTGPVAQIVEQLAGITLLIWLVLNSIARRVKPTLWAKRNGQKVAVQTDDQRRIPRSLHQRHGAYS
jgi:hypothetical protein